MSYRPRIIHETKWARRITRAWHTEDVHEKPSDGPTEDIIPEESPQAATIPTEHVATEVEVLVLTEDVTVEVAEKAPIPSEDVEFEFEAEIAGPSFVREDVLKDGEEVYLTENGQKIFKARLEVTTEQTTVHGKEIDKQLSTG